MSNAEVLNIDYDLKLIWIDDREVKLTPKRWKLFCYLVNNKNRYVSTEELWTRLWNDDNQRGVVKWQAAQLRRALEPVVLEYRSQHGWRLHI